MIEAYLYGVASVTYLLAGMLAGMIAGALLRRAAIRRRPR